MTLTAGVRDGAWVTEAAGVLELSGWPAGMRVIWPYVVFCCRCR
jgi:hypothetical protein